MVSTDYIEDEVVDNNNSTNHNSNIDDVVNSPTRSTPPSKKPPPVPLRKASSEKFSVKLFKTKKSASDLKLSSSSSSPTSSPSQPCNINSPSSVSSFSLSSIPEQNKDGCAIAASSASNHHHHNHHTSKSSPVQSSKSFSIPKLLFSPTFKKNSNNNGNHHHNGNGASTPSPISTPASNQQAQQQQQHYDEDSSNSISDGGLTPESDCKLSEIASRTPPTPRLSHESKEIPSIINLNILYPNNNNNNSPRSPVLQSTPLSSISTGDLSNNTINNNYKPELLSISEPNISTPSKHNNKNLYKEKVLSFSPCSTIEEALSIIIPNLMTFNGLKNARQTSNNEWETVVDNSDQSTSQSHIGSESDTNDIHNSFALFKWTEPNVPLHKEKTMLELGLNDRESLILKTVVLNIVFVKILIPHFSEGQLPAQATLRLTQFTSIRSIIRKLYLKFHNNIDISQHGIFLIDPTSRQEVLLDEDELFSTFNINANSQLLFRTLNRDTENEIISLKSLKLKILVSTSFSRYNYLTLNFDPQCTVSKAIKITGLRTGLLDSLNKCGFYLTPSEDDDDGFWMDEDYTLDSYRLKSLTLLEFKERCRKYTVIIKPLDRKCTFKFDQFVKVSTLFNIIINNEMISNAKDYHLVLKNGPTLENDRFLWSYDIKVEIEFRELPNKLLVFGQNGEKNLVYVDFNDPVQDICERLSTNFGYLVGNTGNNESNQDSDSFNNPDSPVTTRERSFTFRKLGHLVNNIDVRKSLKSQGVQPNDALVLEVIEKHHKEQQEYLSNQNGADISDSGSTTPPTKNKSTLSIKNDGTSLNEERQINIWEEPSDSDENIIYGGTGQQTQSIEAGTLNKLIIHLTSKNTHDLMFMKTLLMTYSSYTTAATLLKKLFERFQVPEGIIDEKEKLSIQLRVGNVIKYWVEHHYEDFCYESTKLMVDFVDTHMMIAFPILGNQIRGCILKRTCGIKSILSRTRSNGTLTSPRGSSLLGSSGGSGSGSMNNSPTSPTQFGLSSSFSAIQAPSSAMTSPSSSSLSLSQSFISSPSRKIPESKLKGLINPRSLFDFDDEEIARQLTLFEFNLYSSIKPTEFLNQAWNKPNIASRKSPTILQMISRFNNVGLWVVSLILEPERVKTRAKRMERIIRIAEKLRELKNYNTLMSFIGGLNNSAILRLKYTRGLVAKRYLDSLDSLEKEMSCEGAYKNYRDLLHNTDPPCVPYIGVYLTDLTFTEEGNPNIIGNNLINFAKYTLLYKVISEVQQYQWSEYNLKVVPIIQTFIKDLTPQNASDLYKISLQKEPKGAQKSEIF
ncbi:hypothetical protein CYY_004241 [Polysphondylium violaceum]|uniref:Ras guanine nucleotide exchange factor n=1 Tax=Polysphondylium violaceum TaxID=133409 RepID=A0A8J4V7Y5_9MYCE|nr:hypothetical protein CYY_004241 [Polysphondylium violaceum]